MLIALSCECSHFHTTFILILYVFPRPVQCLEMLLEIIFQNDLKWRIFTHFFQLQEHEVTEGETGWVE